MAEGRKQELEAQLQKLRKSLRSLHTKSKDTILSVDDLVYNKIADEHDVEALAGYARDIEHLWKRLDGAKQAIQDLQCEIQEVELALSLEDD